MDQEDILAFAHLAGLDNTTIKPNSEWVQYSCPFARWSHKNGRDSSPSFGIYINPDGPSGYNCFACSAKGSHLKYLLRQLSDFTCQPYKEAYNFLIKNEDREKVRKNLDFGSTFGTMSKSAEEEDLSDVPEPERPTMDESAVEKFSPDPHPYILDRGLTEETCRAWGISTDFTSKYPRIVFEIRNLEGELLAFSRRVVWNKPKCQWCGHRNASTMKFGTSRKKGQPKSKGGCPKCSNRWLWPKYQHSKGFHRNWYLYGEHMVNQDHRVGVIVEGNIDPVWLWQCGVANPVATLGSKVGVNWPDKKHGNPGEQVYLMSQLFDKIVLLPDADEAGQEWSESIQKELEGRISCNGQAPIKVFECLLPEGKDPAELSPAEVRDLLSMHDDVWR